MRWVEIEGQRRVERGQRVLPSAGDRPLLAETDEQVGEIGLVEQRLGVEGRLVQPDGVAVRLTLRGIICPASAGRDGRMLGPAARREEDGRRSSRCRRPIARVHRRRGGAGPCVNVNGGQRAKELGDIFGTGEAEAGRASRDRDERAACLGIGDGGDDVSSLEKRRSLPRGAHDGAKIELTAAPIGGSSFRYKIPNPDELLAHLQYLSVLTKIRVNKNADPETVGLFECT